MGLLETLVPGPLTSEPEAGTPSAESERKTVIVSPLIPTRWPLKPNEIGVGPEQIRWINSEADSQYPGELPYGW